ncbi:hypothetical protein TNIN_497731 [Trichonephila inaurata madagascariensis]|uniref:Uncharacterized protein n=1 Tax=Trichonephila inaurata madagascariensis TaxID=2747483 RepID=A0A8X6YUP7_9ARAC|nr:hypothetical protein TNIN_497731 [Trichonephila inaurata madagascariensis]
MSQASTSPGLIPENCIYQGERRKDNPRGTTGSRPPSGVPRATLLSNEWAVDFNSKQEYHWLSKGKSSFSDTGSSNL